MNTRSPYRVIDTRTNRVVSSLGTLQAAESKRNELQNASGECMWVYEVRGDEGSRGRVQCNPTGL